MSSQEWIDLRSDTVTKPSPAMRRAMAEAEVGDDIYGEDPTVNELERSAAGILGKEAALFVPSGVMGNTIGVKVNTVHGQEVICEAHAHILDWELSMTAWFSGCLVRSVAAEEGILRWRDIEANLRKAGPHNAGTGLIEIENTHNMAGGSVYPLEVLDEICDRAHELGIPVHLDGARLFNAAEYLGVPASRVCAKADTVMCCLSKGLGAPVGSLLAGPRAKIDQGRLYRKRLGGGMRQVGVLAAAGRIALEEGPKGLAADHANARLLATGLTRIPGIKLAQREVQTNILFVDVTGTGIAAEDFSRGLKERGVLANSLGPGKIRFVTHCNVSREQCERAVEAAGHVAAAAERSPAISA